MATTRTVKINRLIPGQEVAIVNDSTTGTVVRRNDDGTYQIAWKGRELTLPRYMLGVKVGNRWMTGPHNATESK